VHRPHWEAEDTITRVTRPSDTCYIIGKRRTSIGRGFRSSGGSGPQDERTHERTCSTGGRLSDTFHRRTIPWLATGDPAAAADWGAPAVSADAASATTSAKATPDRAGRLLQRIIATIPLLITIAACWRSGSRSVV
jgi:hypothetical protein